VKKDIDVYTEKLIQQIHAQRDALLSSVDILVANKEKILHSQQDGLISSVESITGTAQQLDSMMKNRSQTRALVVMQQLQAHLNTIEKLKCSPKEYADIKFFHEPVTAGVYTGSVVDPSKQGRFEKRPTSWTTIAPKVPVKKVVSDDEAQIQEDEDVSSKSIKRMQKYTWSQFFR